MPPPTRYVEGAPAPFYCVVKNTERLWCLGSGAKEKNLLFFLLPLFNLAFLKHENVSLKPAADEGKKQAYVKQVEIAPRALDA